MSSNTKFASQVESWKFHCGSWTIFFIAYCLLYVRGNLLTSRGAGSLFITFVLGFTLSLILGAQYRKFSLNGLTVKKIILLVFGVSVAAAFVWGIVDFILTYLIIGLNGQPITLLEVYRVLRLYTQIFLAWNALYFILKAWFDWRIENQRAEDALMLAKQAQLQMLRYQLHPHFLFNSLSSIRSLIAENPYHARQMVSALAEFLRYTLVSRDVMFVPLREEIRALQEYFSIQKYRYEDTLETSIDVSPEAESFQVLSFLIHPLVENSVKYGMQTSELPLRIEIVAKVIDDCLHVSVSNSGSWVEQVSDPNESRDGTGTGHSNVRARLANAFPRGHQFEVSKSNGRVTVDIVIPRVETQS